GCAPRASRRRRTWPSTAAAAGGATRTRPESGRSARPERSVPPGRLAAGRAGATGAAGSIGGPRRAPGSLASCRGDAAGRWAGRGPAADHGRAGSDAGRRDSALLLDDRVLLDLDLEVEQVPDGLFLDAVHHGAEHVVALALVLDQRVALAVTAQADALAQVVHLVQVLAPLAVEH